MTPAIPGISRQDNSNQPLILSSFCKAEPFTLNSVPNPGV